jgi:hypothetical protein
MDSVRFEQFKKESDILIETSLWLVKQMDKAMEEESFYENNPDLDSYDKMDKRIAIMEELEQRARWEQKTQQLHYEKYIDIINSDNL